MSTRPTVLNTKREYGMIICVPKKKEEMTRTTSRHDIATYLDSDFNTLIENRNYF
jgi:hypothetical protein